MDDLLTVFIRELDLDRLEYDSDRLELDLDRLGDLNRLGDLDRLLLDLDGPGLDPLTLSLDLKRLVSDLIIFKFDLVKSGSDLDRV